VTSARAGLFERWAHCTVDVESGRMAELVVVGARVLALWTRRENMAVVVVPGCSVGVVME
jgi:hypothetical protein